MESGSTPLTAQDQPLFVRVASDLRGRLRADGFRPGDRLPSERVLAERLAVSRVTVRSALTALAREGVVRSSAARGWFVLDSAGSERDAVPGHTVEGFADYARRHGLTTGSDVLDVGVRAATVDEAETLRVAPGADVFDLLRLRSLDGRVVVIEHNRLPLDLCPALASTDFANASLYAVLRGADPPQFPRMARYSAQARRPDRTEQRLLEVPPDWPMLEATQLTYNQAGRPLEFTVCVYRGDRYRFSAAITD